MNGRKDKRLCIGCRDDWYNHNQAGNAERGCWGYESAEVVTRYRLPWDLPTLARNCVTVKTLSCHREPGRYAFLKELPKS